LTGIQTAAPEGAAVLHAVLFGDNPAGTAIFCIRGLFNAPLLDKICFFV